LFRQNPRLFDTDIQTVPGSNAKTVNVRMRKGEG
jgi:hypothetical protein